VLIVVAGIAAMLAALATAFFVKVRSEAVKSRIIVLEAQARVMLNAGLTYIQEGSRFGWGTEAYGWIDVRDGSLGPRGPLQSNGSVPAPTWWRPGYGVYPPSGNFPSPGVTAFWPAPGGAARCDLYAWTRPPYAIELTYAYNPVPFAEAQTQNITITGWRPPDWNNKDLVQWQFIRQAFGAPGAKGALQPQPIASTWNDFATGDPVPVSGSEGLGWFRCYREGSADRDNDGVPFYDRVAFPTGQWSTFIITCAAGASRGFRDWAEVVGEGAENQFSNDEQLFLEIRRDERILWYRVEWGANTGGVFKPVDLYLDNNGQYNIKSSQRIHDPALLGGDQPRNFTGTIRWIQRLDREPPRW